MRDMAQEINSGSDEPVSITQDQQSICTEKDAERAVELLRKLRQQATHHSYRSDPAAMEQLELLERALDSDLFKSVCQVYDQIYDTANITGSSELKASASAKATVAVFSASIGHSHPRTVELKTDEGLGFNVMSFDGSAVFISQIMPGGVADKHGGLRRGDQLISINGINVENADHNRAVEFLKAAKGRVTLVVKYMPTLLSQIEASYAVKQQQQQQQQQQPQQP